MKTSLWSNTPGLFFLSDPELVKMWLHSMGLEQYFNQFQASGFTSLVHCAKMSLQSLADMGIDLPGHKRRLYREGN